MNSNNSTNEAGVNRHVRVGAVVGLAITQLVLGAVCVLLGVVLLAAGCEDDRARKHGNGIWSGLFYVLTGLIGVAAGKTRLTNLIVAFLTLSIISSILCLTTLGYGAANVDQARDEYNWVGYEEVNCDDQAQNVSIGCGSMLIILAIAEAIIAVIAACFCCEAVCCGRQLGGTVIVPSSAPVAVHYTTQPHYGPPPAYGHPPAYGYSQQQIVTTYQPAGLHVSVGSGMVTTTQVSQPPPYRW